MHILTISFTGSLFFIFLITGCADLTIAKNAYNNGNYKLAHKHYQILSQKGFPIAQKGMGDISLKLNPDNINIALTYYMMAYQNGYAKASINISKIKKEFPITNNGYIELYYWLKKAKAQGSISASYDIAILQLEGKGTKKDIDKGLKKLRNLSKNGYAQATYLLGILYLEGKYTQQNENKALNYFHIASQQGHKTSKLKEASIYANKNSHLYNPTKAKKLFLTIIKQNNPNDILKYAQFLEQENGINKESYSWYEKASNFGQLGAKLRIANLKLNGLFLSKDIQAAKKDYEELVDYKSAKERLGDIYRQEQNLSKAIDYYKKAYMLGRKNVALKIAQILHQQQKIDKAMQWYKISAQANNPKAKYELSLLIYPKEPQKSLTLLKDASDTGYSKAQLAYGEYLFYNQDQVEGLKLIFVAAQKGEQSAVQLSMEMISQIKNLDDVNRAYLAAKKNKNL